MLRVKHLVAWFDAGLLGDVSGFSAIIQNYAQPSWGLPLGSNRITLQSPAPKVLRHTPRLKFFAYSLSFHASVLRSFSTGGAKVNAGWTHNLYGFFRSALLQSRVPGLSLPTQRLVTYQIT